MRKISRGRKNYKSICYLARESKKACLSIKGKISLVRWVAAPFDQYICIYKFAEIWELTYLKSVWNMI
jgi:hypothetical protein